MRTTTCRPSRQVSFSLFELTSSFCATSRRVKFAGTRLRRAVLMFLSAAKSKVSRSVCERKISLETFAFAVPETACR